jgi:RNA-directed DNA polymerase
MIGLIYFLIGFVGFFLFMRWRRKQLLAKALYKSQTEPVRDLSTVTFAGSSDVKQEEIKVGGPLKPLHRRLALRDSRLLPKPPRKPYRYGDPKPPVIKYFTRDQARRFFSSSFRTHNRGVRDLAIDEAQLNRYGLPLWKSEEDIASALAIPPRALRHFTVHRPRERISHYVTFAIPKRNGGGERIIHAPKRRLKAILRQLDALVLKKLPVSDAAHGFVPGRSIASNARPHVGRAVVLRFDIKDCFPASISAACAGCSCRSVMAFRSPTPWRCS